MTCRKLCRPLVAGAALAMFAFGPAFAAQQPDVDPQQMCDAAAAAFQALAANSTDPDKDAATARVTEGVTDCKNGNNESGLRAINEGTAMVHDNVKTKMK